MIRPKWMISLRASKWFLVFVVVLIQIGLQFTHVRATYAYARVAYWAYIQTYARLQGVGYSSW